MAYDDEYVLATHKKCTPQEHVHFSLFLSFVLSLAIYFSDTPSLDLPLGPSLRTSMATVSCIFLFQVDL